MKRITLFMAIISLILLIGCSNGMVCNKPYIQVGTECCLDKDDNSICDSDEEEKIVVESNDSENQTEEETSEENVTTPKETVKIEGTKKDEEPLTPETILTPKSSEDLKDFPCPFIKNGAFNGIIVVGEKAPVEDVGSTLDIIEYIESAIMAPEQCDGSASAPSSSPSVGSARLDTEVADVSAQNVISIGNGCDNAVTAEIMGVPTTKPECYGDLPDSKAIIKYYDDGSRTHLIIAGKFITNTRLAAHRIKIIPQEGNPFGGSTVTISGDMQRIVSVNVDQ